MTKRLEGPMGYIQMPANVLCYIIVTDQTRLLRHMEICLVDLAPCYLTVPKIEFEYVLIYTKINTIRMSLNNHKLFYHSSYCYILSIGTVKQTSIHFFHFKLQPQA